MRTSRTSRCGRCRPASSGRGCTTSSRTGVASRGAGSTPSRSGRAASASGAASASAWPSASGPRCGGASRCRVGCRPSPAAARPGHRTVGQLVEPGTVRAADRSSLGARDLIGDKAVAAGYPPGTTFHPVPLRVPVVPAAVRRADLDRPPVPDLGDGAVRAVRRRVHVHAVLDRAAARRRGVAPVGLAGQRGRLARGVRDRGRVPAGVDAPAAAARWTPSEVVADGVHWPRTSRRAAVARGGGSADDDGRRSGGDAESGLVDELGPPEVRSAPRVAT